MCAFEHVVESAVEGRARRDMSFENSRLPTGREGAQVYLRVAEQPAARAGSSMSENSVGNPEPFALRDSNSGNVSSCSSRMREGSNGERKTTVTAHHQPLVTASPRGKPQGHPVLWCVKTHPTYCEARFRKMSPLGQLGSGQESFERGTSEGQHITYRS